jgi:hypothetical protein
VSVILFSSALFAEGTVDSVVDFGWLGMHAYWFLVEAIQVFLGELSVDIDIIVGGWEIGVGLVG